MAYKKINDVISAELGEARNSTSKSGKVVISGIQDFDVGDFVLIKLKVGTAYRYFSMQVNSIDYSGGNTTLELDNPLKQLFSCILPDVETISGTANYIVKTLLDTVVSNNFANVYVNTQNIDSSIKSYSLLNVKNRYVGDILQDICIDTGYSMWIGYDEINDQPNAFFFKKNADIESLNISFKEGANLLEENLKKSSLNDIINYIFLYYYPDKYPSDESWTETVQKNKTIRAIGRAHLGDAGIVDSEESPPIHLGDVVVRCEVKTKLKVDVQSSDTTIYVDSTTGFDSSGRLILNGGVYDYTSKGTDYFNLANSVGSNIRKETSFVHPYIFAEWNEIDDKPAETKAEMFGALIYLFEGKIKRVRIGCWGGSAGTKILVSLQKQGSLDIPWQIEMDISDYDAVVDWTIYEDGLYSLLVSPSTIGGGYVFYPGMGSCASSTGQGRDSEIAYWWHIGSPMKKGWGLGDYVIYQSYPLFDHTQPDTQPEILIEQEIGTEDLWSGGAFSYNKYWKLENQEVITMAQEGYDCLRLEYAGTYEMVDINVNIGIFFRLNIKYWGALKEIRLLQDGSNYFVYTTSETSYWQNRIIPLSSFTKVGNPTAIYKIQLITTERTFVDSLYFLGNAEGTLLIVKDDTSIQKYGQKPYPFYAKGIVESSMAISLANAILSAKKEPHWQGEMLVEDNSNLSINSSVRIIIDTKNIDSIFQITEIVHYSNGTAKLVVGERELDFATALRRMQKDLDEIKLTVGDNTPTDETGDTPYKNHSVKHQNGGSDEINVGGLSGLLSDEQKSTWDKLTSKPASSIADIDDAVNKKHTHSNKAQLDLVTDGDHDVRTDNPHGVTKTQVGLSEVANLKCNYSGTSAPTVNNDSSQGYSIGSRWFDITNKDEYVCLDATTGNAVWKKTN